MAKRNRYDDKFRASAVLMLEAAGYPDKSGALTATAKHLSVPASTLAGWFKNEHNPPPTEVREEKRIELRDVLRKEIGLALSAAEGVRETASYKDLITAAAILIDKLQLITGQPTANERSSITIERTGLSTLPEHLAFGTNGSHPAQTPIQRSGVWPSLGQDSNGHRPLQ